MAKEVTLGQKQKESRASRGAEHTDPVGGCTWLSEPHRKTRMAGAQCKGSRPGPMGPLDLQRNYSLLCGWQKAKEHLRASSENSGVGILITSADLGLRTSYGHYESRRWRKWVNVHLPCGMAPTGSERNFRTTSQMLQTSVTFGYQHPLSPLKSWSCCWRIPPSLRPRPSPCPQLYTGWDSRELLQWRPRKPDPSSLCPGIAKQASKTGQSLDVAARTESWMDDK